MHPARFASILSERLAALGAALRKDETRHAALAELDRLSAALRLFGGESAPTLSLLRAHEWVATCMPELQRRAGGRIHLELAAAPLEPALLDGALVARALGELVDNAVLAGAQRIVLRVRPQDRTQAELPPELPGGRYLRWEVVDDGAGMSAALGRRALWPGVSGWQREGLGLARVQGIAAALGGRVLLPEPDERGCTMAIELPWRTEKVAPPAPTQRATVLVVDDEPLALRAISRVLRARGFGLTLAEGSLAALGELEQLSVLDVLISDVNMPQMGGFELARRVREKFPEVRLLFISGFPPETLEHVPQPSRVLAKPFTHFELLSLLDDMIAEKTGGAAL